MDKSLKWIGGATAAALLLFGTVTLAGHVLADEPASQPAAAPPPAITPVQPAAPVETVPDKDDPFVIKRILPISGPIKYGEWHWDEEGVPDGPLVMTVDLEARVLSVFRGGYEIGATAVLLGTDEHPTPLGTFPILLKKKHNISSIYDAPMPYTLRLTNDGISIHGSQVENGYASHGCIGTPEDFAAKLFAVAGIGDKVIITKGKKVSTGDSLIAG
jgi:hypothetical protein